MAAKEYSRLVQDTTGFQGAYPLIIPLRVGDFYQIGELDVPISLGNVFNWPGWAGKYPVDSELIGGSETYYAGCDRTIGVTAAGGVTPPTGLGAEATVALSFSSAAGFVLAYQGATRRHVRDVPSLQRHVLELVKTGWWQKNWILVTRGDRGTIGDTCGDDPV